ncbi:protein Vhl [Zeugodacus cucurbitae]|uniref:protein Vhl n=1 Tax=Zeugodacus cucurbitae TaxID=28588 RepID=UPI0005967FA6|nr:protein Vhl [Zeugodacus cucurbitae]
MALEPPDPPAVEIPFRYDVPEPYGHSYVLFCNTTNRVLHLYWLDEGGSRFHTTLAAGAQIKTNTFTHHSWVFCDKDSNELMCVSNVPRFWPNQYRIHDPLNPTRRVPCRKEIKIHYPLRSLRENCLCRIVNTLNPFDPRLAVNIIDQRMSIPHVLKNELKRRLRRPLCPTYINEQWVNNVHVRYNLPRNQNRRVI